MNRFVWMLVLGCMLAAVVSCGSDGADADVDSSSGGMDISAGEVVDYAVDPDLCVGQELRPQFAEYDYQCEWARDKGVCVQMPNPNLGKPYFCALCGKKGDKMICYYINPE